MIVEALVDIGNDGAAPKDLFLWMGSRWPLQTNFRPSASQALQKAFRRGRLEKAPGGKYRLNPNWEGGAVSICNGVFTRVWVLAFSNLYTMILDIEKNNS